MIGVVPEPWMLDALCGQTDPDAFFPDGGERPDEALKVCESCDVREQCLAYALRNGEHFGVWGGMTTRQRNLLGKSA